MKQNEIIVGKTYFFATTIHDHKKDMIGTEVMVTGRKRGKRKPNYHGGIIYTGMGSSPMKFKLSNGRYAQAAELKSIEK